MNETGPVIHNHELGLVVAAVIICLLGFGLTARLFMRVKQRSIHASLVQLILTGVISGSTVWATHFIAMLAYDPGIGHSFSLGATLGSLLIALIGMVLTFAVAMRRPAGFGGVIFGLTVAAMHYTGMSAYIVEGVVVWDQGLVAISAGIGVVLGIIAFKQMVQPLTQARWIAATTAMVLAIGTTHFIGMAAFSVLPAPDIVVSESPLSDLVLSITVTTGMIIVLTMGLSAVLIETRLERETDDKLRHIELQDTLTHLPNRLGLQRELDECDRDIQRGLLEKVGIMTIDFDNFKQINDSYGHQTGDVILRAVANRMNDVLQPGEFLARSGGDEFVAIKTGDMSPKTMNVFAERLRLQILRPVTSGAVTHRIAASIGTSSCPEDGNDVQALLANSDIAMHLSKQNRKRKVTAFKPQMFETNRTKLALTSDLRVALGRQEFSLHYQRQNDAENHRIIGFEALLRWHHPTRGLVSPVQFIPIAEETGMIIDIGHWVLRTAVREAASWEHPYTIAVNVAPQQLVEPSFVESVADILMETGLEPSRLELEITEASVIGDQQNTLHIMQQIKRMGVRMAMDDFGTGYSSLATLQTFPFDKIKIDRSFVHGVTTDEKRAAIVRATVMIANAFGIPVLAEGVEEQEELDFLKAENCREVQGFFFGLPMPLAELHHLLDAEQAKTSVPTAMPRAS